MGAHPIQSEYLAAAQSYKRITAAIVRRVEESGLSGDEADALNDRLETELGWYEAIDREHMAEKALVEWGIGLAAAAAPRLVGRQDVAHMAELYERRAALNVAEIARFAEWFSRMPWRELERRAAGVQVRCSCGVAIEDHFSGPITTSGSTCATWVHCLDLKEA